MQLAVVPVWLGGSTCCQCLSTKKSTSFSRSGPCRISLSCFELVSNISFSYWIYWHFNIGGFAIFKGPLSKGGEILVLRGVFLHTLDLDQFLSLLSRFELGQLSLCPAPRLGPGRGQLKPRLITATPRHGPTLPPFSAPRCPQGAENNSLLDPLEGRNQA